MFLKPLVSLMCSESSGLLCEPLHLLGGEGMPGHAMVVPSPLTEVEVEFGSEDERTVVRSSASGVHRNRVGHGRRGREERLGDCAEERRGQAWAGRRVGWGWNAGADASGELVEREDKVR